ncbi:unnamed protein product [Adineta steineri]|uniref:Uncharacterized protein n=1 Tax=Adineta steineri TaxID=433720 RepID=A0A819IVD8_9BILA|nr:unnamed protein product [Adineta steineri]
MYCRSLCMVSRLAINTSYIGTRCLVASYNKQILYPSQQSNRYLAQQTLNQRRPGRIRRFFRWFGWGAEPIVSTLPPPPPPATTMQRIKRFLSLSPSIERFLLRSHIIEDEDLARLMSKTAAIAIYAMISVSTLGTLGVDTKPLLAGIGITGFTIGFALKEVATNFISGIFLVINKPFVRGCRIKIHGSGGGIEGLVHLIDVRYVHLKTKDRGMVMVPSAIVYTNAFTVFPADDEANAGFMDMTKPPTTDPTKPSQLPSSPSSNVNISKQKNLKMKFEGEPAGSFKKSALSEKL